jgi:hypothetical protein
MACIVISNRSKMTGEMFTLSDLPEDAWVRISEYAAVEGSICAFLAGIQAGVVAGQVQHHGVGILAGVEVGPLRLIW